MTGASKFPFQFANFVNAIKYVYFFGLFESEKDRSEFEKKKGSFCTEPRLFFCTRNIKTQFEGNFFNRRLLKFPENCVLMFRGQKNSLGEVQKLTFFFENSLQIFLSYKVT